MLPDLGVLYRDHAASVWRYARARVPSDADAEDVTSDVFARAMRSTHTFETDRRTPRAWLMGIARHATADWCRLRSPEHLPADVPDQPTGGAYAHPHRVRAAGLDQGLRIPSTPARLTRQRRSTKPRIRNS